MKILCLLVLVGLGVKESEGGTQCYSINNIQKQTSTDVVVLTLEEPSPEVSHCTRVWPNEEPELALLPVPPGCLFFDIKTPIGKDNQVPMSMPGGRKLHWIPENELIDSLDYNPFKSDGVSCKRVLSKTISENKMIIVGEGCDVGNCVKREVNATATCESEEEPTQFLESTGWHRNLGAMLHADFKHFAHQWLPRQFFAETDELDRKTQRKSQSITLEINIENPSLISPPQIVRVSAFPFPAHARVNPPKRGETHFSVHVPKAAWFVTEDVSDCSVEKLRLADLVKLPASLSLDIWKKVRLVRTRPVRGDAYAITDIPGGNPDDLLEAVAVTALTATAGALAIIVASLRK